jgi:hypothetical protein
MENINDNITLDNDHTKLLSRQSRKRYEIAIMEGRVPQRNGPSLYLENEELRLLQQKILLETSMNHTLKLREVAVMVCECDYLSYFFLRLGIFAIIENAL